MKITKITELIGKRYAHVCPVCGRILCENTEKTMMPEFSICPCEKEEWKYVSFATYGTSECVTMVLHQTAPEFGFVVKSNGELMDTSGNHWDSEEQCAKWMNKAAQHIRENNNLKTKL